MPRNRSFSRGVKRRLLVESLENRRVFDAAMTMAISPSVGGESAEPAILRLTEKPVDVVGIEVEAMSRPDDVSAPGPEATPLLWTGNGTWMDGTLDSSTDVDAFQVTLPALTEFTISVSTDTEAPAAEWQLLDANYRVVELQASGSGDTYRDLSAGNYYLVVKPIVGASETPIQYWVNGYGSRVDDPSTLDETATVMTVDWGIGGTIFGENDVDAFQIKLPETDTLTIYGNHDEFTNNWSVTLHQADGSVVEPTPPVDGQDAFASQYAGITEGLYYIVVQGSATAKSDYWISVATNQPVPLPWVRTGVDGGMPMDLAGSTTDDPQLVFMTSLDEVTSVPDEVDEVDEVDESDPVPVELRNSETADDLSDVVLQTLGGSMDEEVTTQSNVNPMDINKDGELTASDVLEVIHYLSLAITQSASSESASSLRAASSLTAEESSLDVNADGAVTAADALVLINRMNTNDIESLLGASNGPSGNQSIAIDEPFVTSDEGAKELALADVGSYGVVYLQIDDDGQLIAQADGEPIDVAVGTDGSLHVGEVLLPAYLVTTSEGEALLAAGYVTTSDELDPALIDSLIAIDQSRFAGYSVMTLVGPDGRFFVLTVSEDNVLSAMSGSEAFEVTVGDDETLVVDGVKLPVLVRKLDDQLLLVPFETQNSDYVMTWTTAVDDVMSQLA